MYRSLTNDERAAMVAVVACADCGDTMYARSAFIHADGANDRLFCRECAGVPVEGPTDRSAARRATVDRVREEVTTMRKTTTTIPDALVVDVGNALLGNDEAPEAWEAFNDWTATLGSDWVGIRTLVARALRWSRAVSPRGDKANRNALRSALASNRPGTARVRGITDARSDARAGEALYRALGPV